MIGLDDVVTSRDGRQGFDAGLDLISSQSQCVSDSSTCNSIAYHVDTRYRNQTVERRAIL